MLSSLKTQWPFFNAEQREIKRIERIPRYNYFKTKLLGKEITAIDSASFLVMQDEIFKKEIYKLNTVNACPRIIDVGANIGISTLYFKLQYPNSKITAFEPDPKAFEALRNNILNSYGFDDVELIDKGVWNEDGELDFTTNKADGGSLSPNKPGSSKITIKTLRFRDYLSQEEDIDLLKVDIEGAETEVMLDCRDHLHKVKYMFLEYHSFANEKQHLLEIMEVLKYNGFRTYIQTNFCPPQPFFNVNTSLNQDLQLNMFAIRN